MHMYIFAKEVKKFGPSLAGEGRMNSVMAAPLEKE